MKLAQLKRLLQRERNTNGKNDKHNNSDDPRTSLSNPARRESSIQLTLNKQSSPIRKNLWFRRINSNKGQQDDTTEDQEDQEKLDPDIEGILRMIRQNIVGSRCFMSTPFTSATANLKKKQEIEMVYADYTASGRCLQFIEDYMLQVVAPMYANTHTEASMTGAQTTNLREEARDIVRQALNAPKDQYAVFFTGTGSTGAIDKLFRQLGFGIPEYADIKYKLTKTCITDDTTRPVVFISHMEHHSNELIWRESIARVVVVHEDLETGQPDLHYLEEMLIKYQKEGVPMIGSFSAGSNVTGIRTPTRTIAKLLHTYGAYAFFDYAGVGPYVDINVYDKDNDDDDANEHNSYLDAVYISPHKFIGGPGSAGVLVARRDLFEGPFGIRTTKPSLPGGGTVMYVSEWGTEYAQDCEVREDAGTPGIPQCIRTGLAFKVKAMVGSHNIEMAEAKHCAMALKTWDSHPKISLIGSDRTSYFDVRARVSIISFNIVSPIMASISSKKYFSKTLREVFPLKCVQLAEEHRKESKRRRSLANDTSNTHLDDDNESMSSTEVRELLLETNGDEDDIIDIANSTTESSKSTDPTSQEHHLEHPRRGSARPPLLLFLKRVNQSHAESPSPLPLHCNFVIALLNDLYGIQGRGGCSCAGPYGHRLYGIDGDEGRPLSTRVRILAEKGYEAFKPGWARVNLNYFISDAEAAFIVQAVEQIATHGWKLLPLYVQSLNSGQFFHRTNQTKVPFSLFDMSIQYKNRKNKTPQIKFETPKMASSSTSGEDGGISERSPSSYKQVLQQAIATYNQATSLILALDNNGEKMNDFTSDFPDCVNESDIWWLRPSEAREELLFLSTEGN